MTVVQLKNYRTEPDQYGDKENRLTSSTALDGLFRDLEYPGAQDHLKDLLEGAVMDAWMKLKVGAALPSDDPFDAVYFAQLTPDPVGDYQASKLVQFSGIKDLSSGLEFDDEWGD